MSFVSSSLVKSFVGFDTLFDEINKLSEIKEPNYPAYNLEKLKENHLYDSFRTDGETRFDCFYDIDDYFKLEEVYNSQTSDDLSKYIPIEEEKAIFIIGDSHAFNLYPSLKESTNKFSFKKFFYCSIKTKNDIFCKINLKT